METDLVALILGALEELARDEEMELPAGLGAGTALFGEEGLLDSVGLVCLIVSVEERLEDRFGTSVTLADERAMSERQSPYRTVGSLAAWAARQLEESGGRG